MNERMNELIDHMSDWWAPKSFFSHFRDGKYGPVVKSLCSEVTHKSRFHLGYLAHQTVVSEFP